MRRGGPGHQQRCGLAAAPIFLVATLLFRLSQAFAGHILVTGLFIVGRGRFRVPMSVWGFPMDGSGPMVRGIVGCRDELWGWPNAPKALHNMHHLTVRHSHRRRGLHRVAHLLRAAAGGQEDCRGGQSGQLGEGLPGSRGGDCRRAPWRLNV